MIDFVSAKNQFADIFTKPFSEKQFTNIKYELEMIFIAP